MKILKEILNLISDKGQAITIEKHNYVKILEKVDANNDEAKFLVNRIISDYFSRLEKEEKEKKEAEERESELVDYYLMLDKYLYATLNQRIDIGITNGRVGKEGDNDVYELKDYKLSLGYKFLTLFLSRDKEIYPITFYDIQDIRFLDCGDRIKTWIYMPHQNWRFYLHFDKKLLLSDIKSGKIDIEEKE
ncbi:MAG: hypothetical protein Q8936_06770 [Bacillota bacterium]|nr:hypothetical protein [Bacillota bacterium]